MSCGSDVEVALELIKERKDLASTARFRVLRQDLRALQIRITTDFVVEVRAYSSAMTATAGM
jgi:predicted phosphoadenosine phosphosulfate sulfurtransferase